MTARWRDFLEHGFTKIDRDYALLLDCLREVFEELGEDDIARVIAGIAAGPGGLNGVAWPERGAQAVSIAFQLLNMVEENAANQIMRAREAEFGLLSEAGMWGSCFQSLKNAGFKEPEILDQIEKASVEPVLTSHPTEAKRWTVLDQHRAIYLLLVELENQMYSPSERRLIRDDIKAGLERLWRTGEILLQKPDVASERRNALYYFKQKFPDVLKLLDQRLRVCWEAAGLDVGELTRREAFPRIRFGSWVGGDRDGHPLVTAQVTRDTLLELREGATTVLHRELLRLEELLGLSTIAEDVPLALRKRAEELLLEQGHDAVSADVHEEPWRLFVNLLRNRLPMVRGEHPKYRFPSELESDILILADSLRKIGAHRIVEENVMPFHRILQVFGFHLASLDIRQNSAFHDRALGQLMESAGIASASDYASWSEEQRLEFLERELQSPRPFLHPNSDPGPEAKAVFDCYKVLSRYIQSFGRAGLGCLIVSMTRSLSDLLTVYLLCREAGLTRQTPEGLICLLPVTPLFETIDDLERSPAILDAFLKHPFTQRSLRYQRRELDEEVRKKETFRHPPATTGSPLQVVMLGYSDSNKDSGILASLCALRKAQMKLLEVGAENGVQIQFFHGRGGTISRGAGPTHRFLESLPPGSLQAGLRVTEQGETVAQKYANPKTASNNLELLCAGTVSEALLAPRRRDPSELAAILDQLAQYSRVAYQELLHADGFLDYYRQATPIDVLEASRIGSRPSRRTGKASLEDLRAIPWVFSWTQSRFYLPGWYGVGSALQRISDESPATFAEIRDGLAAWPFLRYLLINVETNHASADPGIMHDYSALVSDDAVRSRFNALILSEYERTKVMLNKLLGGELQKRRPRFYKTLRARDEGLRVLHAHQVGAIGRWRAIMDREGHAAAEEHLPNLLLLVNAIASGLRTTG